MRWLLLLLLALDLGCAKPREPVYIPDDRRRMDHTQLKRDKAACRAQADSAVAGTQTVYPPAEASVYQRQQAELNKLERLNARRSIYDDCMTAKGWSRVQ